MRTDRIPCSYVSLANVNTNNPQGIAPDSSVNIYADGGLAEEAGIWNHNTNTGELTGWWVNQDNTFVIISYVYDSATKSIAIVADIASYLGMNPSSYQVVGRPILSRVQFVSSWFSGALSR